jgi:sortase B
MFGDLELYKDEDFFKENQTGTLLTLEGVYNLKIFASLLVPANEDEIFNPTLWHDDIEDIINYAEAEALYLNKATLASMRAMEGDLQVLALTTCSHEFTDARTVVLAVMEPN